MTLTNGTLTVKKADLSYTIGNQSQTYGSPATLANPTITGVNGETLKVTESSTGDTATASVGTYAITGVLADGTGSASNYAITISSGTLTVNKAVLAAYTIGNQSQTYGSPATLANPTITGVNGETLKVTESSAGDTATANVGTYAITGVLANGSGSATNYAITISNGTLTVNAASVAASILLLDSTGSGALNDSGNGIITVGSTGVIAVASTSSTSVVVSGNGKVTDATLDLKSTTGTSVTGNGQINGTIVHGESAAVVADPLAALAVPTIPANQISAVNASGNTVVTLQPGTYVGGISASGNAKVTLAAGTYYLKGAGSGFQVMRSGLAAGSLSSTRRNRRAT